MDVLVVGVGIFLALAFNFVNGLNDAANSIATIIATRALTPLKAVGLAAVFNLIGPLVFTTAIAATIGKGIVNPDFLTTHMLLAGMLGAVLWVFITSMLGIPVSSSHALVGGLLGAGIAGAGFGAILWPSSELVRNVIIYLVCGGAAATILYAAICHIRHDDWRPRAPLAFIMGITITD